MEENGYNDEKDNYVDTKPVTTKTETVKQEVVVEKGSMWNRLEPKN